MLRRQDVVHPRHLRDNMCHHDLAPHTLRRVRGHERHTAAHHVSHLQRHQHRAVPDVCLPGVRLPPPDDVHRPGIYIHLRPAACFRPFNVCVCVCWVVGGRAEGKRHQGDDQADGLPGRAGDLQVSQVLQHQAGEGASLFRLPEVFNSTLLLEIAASSM